MPIFLLPENELVFPNPALADSSGLLAIGGDLSPLRLLTAYSLGIFPWYNPEDPIMWWALDPRLICFPKEAKFSKSLMKRIKRNEFDIRIDTNFQQVIEGCARTPRINQENETWITQEMKEAYCQLHELGIAHSFETYKEGKLVGGLYGVSLGKMFSGESMFHLQTDASKFAFYHLVQFAKEHSFDFIDCQQVTPHLQTLGAKPVSRKRFLNLLRKTIKKETYVGKWT